ncbi:hypothetical protein CSIRO_2448 [Bradyrhizobiaceae bacterium SG-6C]|nr:hypothetical protein CSIRO_2448 [Bradyrhizobiaceae bacterium SG-6C]
MDEVTGMTVELETGPLMSRLGLAHLEPVTTAVACQTSI